MATGLTARMARRLKCRLGWHELEWEAPEYRYPREPDLPGFFFFQCCDAGEDGNGPITRLRVRLLYRRMDKEAEAEAKAEWEFYESLKRNPAPDDPLRK